MLDIAKIKSRRNKLGLTQEIAADQCGWKRANWNDIERGRRINISLDTLDAIAAVLQCDPASLLLKPKKKLSA